MGRYGKARSSVTRRVVTWGVVAALAGWGLWQFLAVRRSILAEIQRQEQPGKSRVVEGGSVEGGGDDPLGDNQPTSRGEGGRGETATAEGGGEVPALAAQPEVVVPEVATTQAVVDQARKIDDLLGGADAALAEGNIVDGRRELNAALALMDGSPRGDEVREELAAINTGVFLGPEMLIDDPYAPMVQIMGGDSFLRLGRKYHVPPELLGVLNPQLSATNLKPGTGIKVVYGPFHARVLKEAGRMDLYARDMYVRSFPVTIEDGNFLPCGLYRVRTGGKIRSTAEGGRCWVGFVGADRGTRLLGSGWLYGSGGLRGAPGRAASAGVKLGDSDLGQLYNVLVEEGSLLRIDP